MKRSGICTLVTDFGWRDPYVGVMKGVILGRAPQARIVDLCHEIPPQDVASANFALMGSWSYFPPGTVHVVVVDPGVGSSRRILCAEAGGHVFLAPDNGVLSSIIDPSGAIHAVEDRSLYLCEDVSNTFHGRDIFAPVAARLVSGMPVEDVGSRVTDPTLIERPVPHATPDGGLVGEVIHVDAFGNLITNIRGPDALAMRERASVVFRGQDLGPPVDSYAAVEPGSPLAIVDSFGFLEVAVNRGSAALHFNASTGDPIRLQPKPKTS